MWEKQILLLPGPTQVPPRVLNALVNPQINHRGPEAKKLFEEVTDGTKVLLQTKNDNILLTCSGTGAMEAAVANIMSPGEKALVVSVGSFGQRFAEICRVFNVDVEMLEYPWGDTIDPQDVAQRLEADKNHKIKAVFIQHNETSTGVLNDVKGISEARGEHPALLVVDAVSGLATADLPVDEWNLDVVIWGSQKAFMVPPGLAGVCISQRAWEAVEKCTNSRYYFDLRLAKKFYAEGQTPFTPALSLLFGMQESLKMLQDEGLKKIFERHAMYRDIVWAAAEALNLEMLAAKEWASPSVTAIKAPEGIPAGDIIKALRRDFNVVIAGGQAKLKGKIFRIGHLGFVDGLDLLSGISALEITLGKLGWPVESGVGIRAAEQVIRGRIESNARIDN
jgi:aspartate aminotransferase-like enzyme